MKQDNVARFDCIDIFRGLTIALMLMVDNPGNPDTIPSQLRHASWHGLTLADLVFPCFIFIMGVVIPISINKRITRDKGLTKTIVHIFIRGLQIFLLGLVLNGFPLFDLTVIRIPGVLQRIAVVYLFSTFLFILVRKTLKKEMLQIGAQLFLAFLFLAVYYFLLKHVPVPGHGKGILELQGNLVQYVDLRFLSGHLYKPDWDPEGILSTLPALSSGIFGVVAGMVLLRPDKPLTKITVFAGSGVLLLICGRFFHMVFPYNKNLWSSSFVLLTSGVAILILAAFYLLIDTWQSGYIVKPFKALGSSAIFVYFVSELLRRSLWLIAVHDSLSGQTMNLKIWLCARFITPWAHGLDSLYFSLVYVILWLICMGFLYCRKVYIRL